VSPPHLSPTRGVSVGAATLAALALGVLLGLGGSASGLRDGGGALQLGVLVIEGFAITWLVMRLGRERSRARQGTLSAQEAAEKLEVVLSGINDGITMQDHTGKLVYANRAAARIVGYPSAEELIQAPREDVMKRFELFDERGAPLPLERLPNRALFLGEKPEEALLRFRVVGSDEEHWSRVNATGVFGEDGRLRFVINWFRDVTEQQQKEEELRLSREWFSTALRSIGDAVIATDAHGQVTFMNPVAEQLTGWSSANGVGQSLSTVFSILNESTRQPVRNPVDLALAQGKVVGLANHTLLVRRDGTEVAIDDSAAPIRGLSGAMAGVVLVFRDVTAERRAADRREFLSRATLELNSSLDYGTTLGTVARLAVPRMADWCAVDIVEQGEVRRLAVAHVDPEKVASVAELQRRYPPDPNAARGIPHILRTGKPELMKEIPASLLKAAARDAEHGELIQRLALRSYIGVPMSWGGETFGVISLVMAESNRAYSEDDLEFATALADRAAVAVENARLFQAAEQAKSTAELANRTKDDFLAMLGHELRNPLAPIVTALDVMKRRPEGNMERERATIERQVRHVVRLVDDLLDISRIIRGRVELAREPVDVGQVVQAALEAAGPLLSERQHRVASSVAPGLVIIGDAVRLTQVMTNLLTNAAKYTDPGGHIQLDVERDAAAVLVRVKDNGIGIAADMLSSIFDLFVQAPQTIERARGGLGLGLTIVQSLVSSFGGTVTAKSAGPGKGSEFLVRLPLSSAPEAVNEAESPAPKGSRKALRVLVVDDNVDALEMLVEALRLLGHDAHAADDAETALAVAAQEKPRLALLDIGLPVIDGYELGRQLRALPGLEDIQLVALTGYGQASDRERSAAAGFAAHLVKPVDLAAIDALIQSLDA
jgi:PAS domain S-box-containing protein